MHLRLLSVPLWIPALLAQGPAEVKAPRPPMLRAEKTAAETMPPKAVAPGVVVAPTSVSAQPDRQQPVPTARRLGDVMPAGFLHVDESGDGPIWAGGRDWKANCTSTGLEFVPFLGSDSPRNFPVAFDLRSIHVGGHALELGQAGMRRDGNRVELRHGSATERFDLRADGVEQTFVFSSLPVRGALELVLDVRTELVAEATADGIAFRSPLGGVSYRKLCAIDADGDRIELVPQWRDGAIVLAVPEAFVKAADLPLVIDPLIQTIGVSTASTVLENAADLSWDETAQQWLVVWERWYSQTDHDVWAQRLDAAMTPVGAPFTVDYTSAAWAQPRVANNNLADNHLVVAQVSATAGAAPFWIAGRIVGAGSSGVLGTQFDIERAGVGGAFTGDKLAPDVGGDPYLVGPTYYTVVWERVYSATDHDVHMKQVDVAGALRSTTPTVIDGAASNETSPQISRSNGPGVSTHQRWTIAYQRTYAATDEDIRGAMVTWDGQQVLVAGNYTFSVDYSGRNHVTPSVSSPTNDPAGARIGMFTYVWSIQSQSVADLDGAVVDLQGNVLGYRYGLELGAAANRQFLPAVDCDGCRFTVAFAQYPGTGNPDVFASTFDWDAAGSQLLPVEDHVGLGLTQRAEWWPQVASQYASSGVRVPGLGIAYESAFNPSFWIVAQSFDALGNGGFAVRSTGCGGLSITGSGIPAIGMSIGVQTNGTAALRGFVFGVAADQPLAACPGCRLGVAGSTEIVGQLTLNIPCVPALVGGTASVQGFEFGVGPCLGQVKLSNTLDITVR